MSRSGLNVAVGAVTLQSALLLRRRKYAGGGRFRYFRWIQGVVLTLSLWVVSPSFAQASAAVLTNDTHRVVFVCEHGSVKSLIATMYFNQRAQQRGLGYTAVARGTTPEASVPATVQQGLRAGGFDVVHYVPQPLKTSDVNEASLVVSFDQDVTKTVAGRVQELKWDNLPAVLANYERGRDAILQRVDKLIDQLASASRGTPRKHHTAVHGGAR